MLKIKLQRIGRRHYASYRIVVTDSRTGPKSRKHVEILGYYNPQFNNVKLKDERASYWLLQGVKPTDTVYNIFVNQKIINAKKRDVSSKKNVGKKARVDEEANKDAEKPTSEIEEKEENMGVDPNVASVAKITEEIAEEEVKEKEEAKEEAAEESKPKEEEKSTG